MISGGPRGQFGHAPQKANHRGNMTCPRTEVGTLNSLGPLAVVDFLSGFRAPQDGSGPRGKHQDSEAALLKSADLLTPSEPDASSSAPDGNI